MKIPCFIFALLFLTAPGVGAQTGRIEYFTVTDGLSTREINDLHIGKDGYLWIATLDGLNRFDGHNFLTFGQGAFSDSRLSRGAVKSVTADNEEKLVITFNDFYGYFDQFDPRDFTVNQVGLAPSSGVVGYPRCIETDRFGRTFVVTIGQTGTKLYEYTDTGFKVIFEQDEDGWLSLAPRIELLPLSNGQFLLYDEEHGFRYFSASGRMLDKFFPPSQGQRRFYTMAEGTDGYVYLTFRDGYPLYRWLPGQSKNPLPVPNLDDGLVYTRIFTDQLGQLLFSATEDILGQGYPDEYYLLDTAGKFSLFERDLPTKRLVTAAAAIDFNATTYFGLREGLGVMQRYVRPIQSYLTNPTGQSLYQHLVRGIAEDARGTVYVIEADGMLYSMEANSNLLEPRLMVDSEGKTIALREAGQLIYDRLRNTVWGFAQPAGLEKGGLLLRHDLNSGVTSTYNSPYTLTSMAIGPEGKLYLAGSDPSKVGLLMSFDPSLLIFEELMGDGNGEAGIRNLPITYLYPSRSGLLLLGTRNRGLVGYDPVSGATRFYQQLTENNDGVAATAQSINSIYEDTGGRWWLATDGGLQVYDPADESTVLYGRKDGLSSNSVVGVLPDSTGGFWVSTHNGLVHLPQNPKTGSYRRYYQEDGLVNDDFSRFSFHRDRTGRYFFGGDLGLSVFRDQDLSIETAGSDVMLTEVTVYGRGESRTITRNLSELTDVKVAANEKSIAVSFALPVGQRPSQTLFRVKLEGFTEEWRELRNESTVRYNNLPSGKYRLIVQGAGPNGNFGEQKLILNIRVRQYLIEKTWFQFLIAVVIVGLFFYILQGRLRERLRNERLRTQLSSDIHDEVSGLLAGITLQAELLQNRTDDEKLKMRLRTVGDAGRNAMSKMSDVIWSIDSRRDTIGNLLQRMQEHADEVLLPLDIHYDFTATGFNQERELAGTVRQDLYFIFKETINNIARHSNATFVEIELEQFAQTFEMFIRDNGVGAQKEKEISYSSTRFTPKTGQGKDNLLMRAQRLRAELSIDDREGYTLTLRMRRLA